MRPLRPPASAEATRLGTEAIRPIGIGYHVVRMACLSPCVLDGDFTAYLRGIRVGSCEIAGRFEPGDLIEFPIRYLPWVDLPAEIRFVRARDGAEIASPFALTSAEEAISLVGLGDLAVEGLSIDHGILRGVAVNRVNGLLKPQMFARINGVVPRAVTVETPRLIDNGGASAPFSVRLDPADLGENGLTVDLFVIGAEAPVASIAYRRADLDDAARRIAALEARLDQIREATGFQFDALDQQVSSRIDTLQERIDTFIEYAASLLFDRLAATEVPEVPGAAPADPDVQEKTRDFLEMLRAGPATVAAPAKKGAGVELPLTSPAFTIGWHEVEGEVDREFRWMGQEAVVFNPEPERPLAEVEIAIARVFAGRAPMLRCFLDDKAARLSRDPGSSDEDTVLRIRPESEPVTASALRIESLIGAATPAGSDRPISVAVSRLVFHYVPPAVAEPAPQAIARSD